MAGLELLEHRAVAFEQEVLAHLDDEIRADPNEQAIEGAARGVAESEHPNADGDAHRCA